MYQMHCFYYTHLFTIYIWCISVWLFETETKWLNFADDIFKFIHFIIGLQWPNLNKNNLGSDNGLVINRPQVVISTNNGLLNWRLYASLGLEGFTTPYAGLLATLIIYHGVSCREECAAPNRFPSEYYCTVLTRHYSSYAWYVFILTYIFISVV